MSRIILPLRTQIKSGVSGEDALLPMEVFLKGWLERSLSFPPLVLWQSGEDVQTWFQLVISCSPVREKAEEAKELQRLVSAEERTLLLDLFRKQRQDPSTSSVVNQLPAVQILLARLIMIAVSYCGNDLNEDDWDFVSSTLKHLIQPAVVVMEETSENINACISSISSMEKEKDTLEGLGHIVLTSLLNALVNANAQELQDALFHRWKQKTYIQQMHGRETSQEATAPTITNSGKLYNSDTHPEQMTLFTGPTWTDLIVLPPIKDWMFKFKPMLHDEQPSYIRA